jgi:hypothetical protein
MKRNITRTWTTKKGVVKTKTYTYQGSGKSRRGLTLVGKNGKINKKNIEKFKNEVRADSSLTAAEKQGIISDINIMTKQRAKEGRKLTTTGFYGEMQGSRVERLLANAGYSLEEAAEELNITEADLLDANNWSGDIFKYAGISYQVKFTYTGSLFTRI